jgi:hypothetical protein
MHQQPNRRDFIGTPATLAMARFSRQNYHERTSKTLARRSNDPPPPDVAAIFSATDRRKQREC